MRRRLDW